MKAGTKTVEERGGGLWQIYKTEEEFTGFNIADKDEEKHPG